MPESRRRHILGPLLLIFLGMALLLDQLGIWSFSWTALLQWWPLLLVLLGLEILLGRSRAGGVILVAVALGVALLLVMRVPLQPRAAELAEEQWSLPAEDVASLSMRLTLSAGDLTVAPSTDDDQAYAVVVQYDARHTQVTHEAAVESGQATVAVTEARSSWVPLSWAPWSGDFAETWQVTVNPEIVTTLDVTAGAGQAILDLTALTVERVQLDMGLGRAAITLPAEGTSQVFVNAGVGELMLTVPEGAAVRLRVDGGLGTVRADERFIQEGQYYYTPEYPEADERVEVDVDGGVGTITLR